MMKTPDIPVMDKAQKRQQVLERLRGSMAVIGLVVILAMFAFLTEGRFLTVRNLALIAKQSCIFICAACGATFVISQGNLDIAFGGILLMAGTFGLMAAQIHPYLLFPIVILVSVACECIIGGLHVLMGVPTFVVSMAMSYFGKGVAALILSTNGLSLPKVFNGLGKDHVTYGVTIFVVVAAILVSKYTKLGKYNRCIGSNENAAVASGVSVNWYKILAFIASGITIGIAVLLYLCRTRGIATSAGSGYELNILTIMVLGAIPLTGGTKVKTYCAVIGGFMLITLDNGMAMCGVGPEVVGLVKGLVFIGSVVLSFDRKSTQLVQ